MLDSVGEGDIIILTGISEKQNYLKLAKTLVDSGEVVARRR